jgi:hypothetical protein
MDRVLICAAAHELPVERDPKNWNPVSPDKRDVWNRTLFN